MCGEDSRDIAGLPIDQIQQAIAPNDAQRAALDDLANASVKAAQDIKAACPTQIALTAPGRLAAMQQRIEAMISAVGTVQPPLQKFYDLLSDEQKARLNALGEDQRRAETAKNKGGSLTENCGAAQAGVTAMAFAPRSTQGCIRPMRNAPVLRRCRMPPQRPRTCSRPHARRTRPSRRRRGLTAVGKRLDVMLQAVKSVHTRAGRLLRQAQRRTEGAIRGDGPRHTAASEDQPSAPRTHAAHARHHHFGYGGLIRRLMSAARW